MSYPMHDILIISLQFFYAFGGLILMGSLIFSIIKNQALVNEKKLRFEPQQSLHSPADDSGEFQSDFDAQLASQMARNPTREVLRFTRVEKTGDTAPHGNASVEKSAAPGKVSGTGQVRGHAPLKNRAVPARQGLVHGSRAKRYRLAVGLVAKGFTTEAIGKRVGLPRCEVDLIANLDNGRAGERWKDQQALLEAIDSGIC